MIGDSFLSDFSALDQRSTSAAFAGSFRFKRLSIRALSIGVSVKLTSSETRIANDIVSAMRS